MEHSHTTSKPGIHSKETSVVIELTNITASNPDEEIHAPFNDLGTAAMEQKIRTFLEETRLHRWQEDLRKGAYLAQDSTAFDHERLDILALSDEEKAAMIEERSARRKPWKQPRTLKILVLFCALGAAVQGWDEAAVNGAQVFYRYAFNIDSSPGLLGLVNSAPYLCCALSCLLTQPLNIWLGRRGTIFLTTWISALACLAQAFSQNWRMMFVFRLILGLGVGPKSATIPIFASECAPAESRGALVMLWQQFTAFGIMLGYVMGVAFGNVQGGYSCGKGGSHCGLNWRLIIGSPMVLPFFQAGYVYTLPESPRWLLLQAHKDGNSKKHQYYEEAFLSFRKLRHSNIQAARDIFLIHHQLLIEKKMWDKQDEKGRKRGIAKWFRRLKELFSRRRNARAVFASLIVMLFQQFCGVNIVVYYSATIFQKAAFSTQKSLLLSLGFGVINFVFAIPALYWIDKIGRRPLLLWTFPLMALFHFLLVISFQPFLGNKREWCTLAFMYLFSVVYSVGEGPVPFVYASESMPLYTRDLGMGFVTAINWFFNFFLAITWLKFQAAFGLSDGGAFLLYGGFCILGWVFIFLFVPETKGKTLEGMDEVFSKGTVDSMPKRVQPAARFVASHILRQKSEE